MGGDEVRGTVNATTVTLIWQIQTPWNVTVVNGAAARLSFARWARVICP